MHLALRLRSRRIPRAFSAGVVALSFATMPHLGRPLRAEDNTNAQPTVAERREDAERRMALIEALAPPETSRPYSLEEELSRLQQREDHGFSVVADLLAPDGTPLARPTADGGPARLKLDLDANETVARFRHWEKGCAPLLRDIPLPAMMIAAAKAQSSRDRRVVTLEPLALERGFPASVRLQDPEGKPVPRAVAFVYARPRASRQAWNEALRFSVPVASDSQGALRVENLSPNLAVLMQVWAPGFQPEERIFDPSSDADAATWTLTPAPLFQGRVVDRRSRTPLAGVQVQMTRLMAPTGDLRYSWEQVVNALPNVSDAEGRFVLPAPPPGWDASALLTRAHYAARRLGDLSPAAGSGTGGASANIPEFALSPGHRLAGRLRVPAGFLRGLEIFSIDVEHADEAPADPSREQRAGSLWFRKRLTGTYTVVSIDGPVFDPEATEIPFVFPALPEGRLRLRAFFTNHKIFAETHVDLDADHDDIELSVAAAGGGFEVSLVSASGETLPVRGRLGYYFSDGKAQLGCLSIGPMDAEFATLRAGKASAAFQRPSSKPKIVFTESGLVGYRFIRPARHRGGYEHGRDLPEDNRSLRVEIPVEPAGALRVRVVNDDGQPPPDGEGAVRYVFLGPEHSASGTAQAPYRELTFSPAPLDRDYEVLVARGHRVTSTGKVRLDLENPVAEPVLRFAPGVRIMGRVLDSSGRPVAGTKLRLGYQYIDAQPTILLEAGDETTGADGGFAFDGINQNLPSPWWLETVPVPGASAPVPRLRIPLEIDPSRPLELRLPKVHVAHGRLLHARTGLPVAGVEVSARIPLDASVPGDRPAWTPLSQPAVAPTDANGAFRFDNLTAGAYGLFTLSGTLVESRDELQAPSIKSDTRKRIDVLRVPASPAAPNVFWFRPYGER